MSLSVDSSSPEKYFSIFSEAFSVSDWRRFCCFGLFKIKFVNWVWKAKNVGSIDLTSSIFCGN